MNKQAHLPYLLKQLQALVNTPSPSGMTHLAEAHLMKELQSLGFAPFQSRKGAVMVQVNQGEGPGILLSAHIDTLGLMVRSVKANGRLRVTQVGGFPLQYAEQENVLVHTREDGQIPGTFRMNQPAVHYNRDLSSAERKEEDMEVVLDARTSTQQETLALGISPGDFISLDPRFVSSGEGYIKSRHLDDKASACVLLTLARAFQMGEAACRRPVTLMFTNFEETGHGASAGHPGNILDMIAVDMGVVGGDLAADETMVSICAKDSGGPYNRELTWRLADIAKQQGLAYSVDIYPFYGSDASAALRAGYDYRHALVGPGVAASHGYERTHEDGLWNTLLLLKHYLADPA